MSLSVSLLAKSTNKPNHAYQTILAGAVAVVNLKIRHLSGGLYK